MIDAGFDFRATSGYVTDPANCTYDISEVYPVTRGGYTFGWGGADNLFGSRDRNNAIDPRLAGCNQTGGGGDGPAMTWRVDLPAGTYDIQLGIGDAGVGGNAPLSQVTLKDGSTPLFTVNSDHSNPFWDAQGTGFANDTAWVLGQQALRSNVITGASLSLVLGDGTHQAQIAHIRITTTSEFPVPSGSPQQVIAGWGWR